MWWSQAVWFESNFHWHVNSTFVYGIRDWVESRIDILKRERVDNFDDVLADFFNLVWGIWISRNKAIFEGKPVNPLITIKSSREASVEYIKAISRDQNQQSQSTSELQRHSPQIWTPPPANSVKINVDGAFDDSLKKRSSVVVVRDENGILLTGSAKRFPCCSPIFVEAVKINK